MELLRIHNNQIDVIEDLAFVNLVSLKSIQVDSNKLKHWNREWFTNTTKLEIMNFQNNKIRTIPRRAFAMLNKISAKDVTLDNNPWKCPCLDRIAYWVYKNNGTIRASSECAGGRIPVCAYPSTFSQTCLEHVDEDVTKKYLKNLKSLDPPLPEYCVLPD
ncbi:leucine-rich repeat-containing protein 19-like [Sitophilus oryzae]|uniref:Leucine-rich repeat-containing protein 19-like n=1 Tax=Sitophilus oryzae TaxID=7048 RepID=A0A6J2XAH6_SITOR|nr:leucine-rich repeat-containing protein 19-like [Sitophilus oryzae]